MIGDVPAPFRPILFIFPFKNPFYFEIPDILGGTEMNYPKPAPANIGDPVSLFQDFLFGNFCDNAVKMSGLAGIFFGYRRAYIFNGLSADGAVGGGQGIRGQFKGGPFRPFADKPLGLIVPEFFAFFFLSGISGAPPPLFVRRAPP
jgi:hypothetical protein